MAFEPSNRNFDPSGRNEYGRPGHAVPPLPAGALEVPVAHAAPAVRAAFLNKVYLTMTAGVAVSMASGFYVATQVPQLIQFMFTGGWIVWIGVFLALMGVTFAVHAVSRVPGINILAFGAFTALIGAVLLAPPFAISIARSGGYETIWNAFGVSALVFGGLTAFVVLTGKDFSFMGGALFMGFWVLVAFTVGSFFLGSSVVSMAITCAGLLLFSLFVLYTTSQILFHYTADMWMAGAINLFVDFINIFIRILYLFMGRSDD